MLFSSCHISQSDVIAFVCLFSVSPQKEQSFHGKPQASLPCALGVFSALAITVSGILRLGSPGSSVKHTLRQGETIRNWLEQMPGRENEEEARRPGELSDQDAGLTPSNG